MRAFPLFEQINARKGYFYHTIYDNWQHAVFDSYAPVFNLVTDFIGQYSL